MLARALSRFGRRRLVGQSVPAHRLTPDHVVWGYRLFLDREPENREVVRGKARANANTSALRLEFLSSYEFRRSHPELGLFLEPTVVIKEIGSGLRLFVDLSDEFVGLCIARGAYEVEEAAFVRSRVEPGQTVVDVGANIGFFTVLLADLVQSTGRVFAFEPLESNIGLMLDSLRENRQTARVVVRRAAVGETAGVAELVVNRYSRNSGDSYLGAPNDDLPPGCEIETVPVVRLDDERLTTPVDFVKIDVEGAELLALRGARALLTRDRPTILCEINPRQLMLVSGCQPADFIAEVESYGYHCRLLRGGALLDDADDLNRPDVRSVVFERRP
jgi:FkbM family methyltransferase